MPQIYSNWLLSCIGECALCHHFNSAMHQLQSPSAASLFGKSSPFHPAFGNHYLKLLRTAYILFMHPLSFLELSRPLARPPGAGRLEVEGFGWAWDRILRRKCGPGPWARARAGPWLGPSISSSIFGPKPIQILQLPASQPLEAALAAD